MADRRTPSSTYRLQLHAGFTFQDATAVVPYLDRLGVSHLYLSPILQAAPGSMHGYDVVDHSQVSRDLGGASGFVDLAETAHRHGLGVVIDVVPNHMAIPTPERLNRQLWETLREGRSAATAHWFDVDWDQCDAKIGLPVLGASFEETVDAGDLRIDDHGGEPVLRYEDHCFPLAAQSDQSDLAKLLSQQHYQLADWRDKDQVLNYRRFFDVDTLIAIRVELEDVFDATHAVLLDLHHRGLVDGFRIDHPDGLADPLGYLERLHDAAPDAWIVVEKILEPGESLPGSWPCAGTTGYDAITAIQAALVPAIGPDLDRRWQATGGEPSFRLAEVAAKRLVVADLFQAEIQRLARAAVVAAGEVGDRLAQADAAAALSEMLVHTSVYRAYVRPGHQADPEAIRQLDEMQRKASTSRPDLSSALATLGRLLADTGDARGSHDAGRDLVVRFQQVCGPVMAKGVEDTTLYRWHRMIALNEVGGDPLSLDSPRREALHAWAEHQAAEHPLGMTTLSTHDTKRNEDLRARLLAVAEDLAGWDTVTRAVMAEARVCDVDAPTAYLLTQTLIGAWPLSAERLVDYLRKAVREAKQFTTWNEPNEDYERRVFDLAERCLAEPVTRVVAEVLAANAEGIRATTLGSKLLQLTMPGAPDVYQGGELVSPALVDPDNRRPVEYDVRGALLDQLDVGPSGEPGDRALDAEKMWVTSRALRLRRGRLDLFGPGAGYRSLEAASEAYGVSEHVLGFIRGSGVATVVTRWPKALGQTGWGDVAIPLPAGTWTDVLSGMRHDAREHGVPAEMVFRRLPVALLLRDQP